MSIPPKKTVFDFLERLAPKATPADEAEARRLGVTTSEYRKLTLEVNLNEARQEAELARLREGNEPTPADISAEEAEALRLRREPGIIKPRNASPNIFVQAAKTPGEVAQTILFVICYVVGLAGSMILWGERIQKIPGIFQCVLLGLLIIPSMWASSRIWSALGERARDVIRALVRFWPVTLIVLFFLLVVVKMIRDQVLH